MRDHIDTHVDRWMRELPWLDPIKEEVLSRMATIVHLVESGRAQAVADDEGTMWQLKLLMVLRREGEPYRLSPSDLAEALGSTRGAVSTRLAVLEGRQLVRRTHDHRDRRRVTVELTEAGIAALDDILRREEERERALLAPLSTEEQNDLAELLRRVVAAIEAT